MPRKPKFTMDDYFAQMEEIRQRVKQRSLTTPVTPLDRIRQAVLKNKSKLPGV